MFVKGILIDITKRKIEPKNGQNFQPFEQCTLLVKENPERNPEKVTCSPEQLNGAEIGKPVQYPVYVRAFNVGGRAGYELRVQS